MPEKWTLHEPINYYKIIKYGKKTNLSCIQPTGEMHIGNYFRAVKNWTLLQEQYDWIYGVVNYHAMTMPYKPSVLKANTLSMLTDLIACGIDPAYLFIQSMVPEHAELAWILGCVTSYADLKKQIQFKYKSSQEDDKIFQNLYPVDYLLILFSKRQTSSSTMRIWSLLAAISSNILSWRGQ